MPNPRVYMHAQERSRTHAKDPVVHVRVRYDGLWKYEKTQRALYNDVGLGSATLLQLAFLEENDPEFSIGTTKCTNYKLNSPKNRLFDIVLVCTVAHRELGHAGVVHTGWLGVSIM